MKCSSRRKRRKKRFEWFLFTLPLGSITNETTVYLFFLVFFFESVATNPWITDDVLREAETLRLVDHTNSSDHVMSCPAYGPASPQRLVIFRVRSTWWLRLAAAN